MARYSEYALGGLRELELCKTGLRSPVNTQLPDSVLKLKKSEAEYPADRMAADSP